MKNTTRYFTIASTTLILPISVILALSAAPIAYYKEPMMFAAIGLCVLLLIQLLFKNADARPARDAHALLAVYMILILLASKRVDWFMLYIPYGAWISYYLHKKYVKEN